MMVFFKSAEVLFEHFERRNSIRHVVKTSSVLLQLVANPSCPREDFQCPWYFDKLAAESYCFSYSRHAFFISVVASQIAAQPHPSLALRLRGSAS